MNVNTLISLIQISETKNVSKALALGFFNVYLKNYSKELFNEVYADSLCKNNSYVTDIIWNEKQKSKEKIVLHPVKIQQYIGYCFLKYLSRVLTHKKNSLLFFTQLIFSIS